MIFKRGKNGKFYKEKLETKFQMPKSCTLHLERLTTEEM